MTAKKKGKAKPVIVMTEKTSAQTEETPAPVKTPAETSEKAEASPVGFPIVGIGASAGGLAAIESFFSGMPADIEPGMAFVLVQHLAPDHKSILVDLIRRYTRMQVFEVTDGMIVQPNCAYIIPPGRDMALLNGALQLLEPVAPRGQRLPIDFFFRSLAQDQHQRAIGIVLSGTGSDGTLGIRAIKGEGGMVMVQHPASAEYDGMPRSAIATGLVDYELPPAEMPAQLMAYVAHAFDHAPRAKTAAPIKAENELKKIFILLRTQTGHDFSQYKPSTVLRRIERRMAVHQIEGMDGYIRYLQETPQEIEALFRDMLIGVTKFFRDSDAFRVLEEKVVPELFSGKSQDTTIRIWVPGCSTGEEAYSIAILLQERMEALKQTFKVQIFATDIDSQAIANARTGIYPASIATDIAPHRLSRFFSIDPDGGSYRIHKAIRDMLIFSEQDLIKDPPFSKLDLISCRNLLIYLAASLQKKLIPLFHYSLNPSGFLFLGTSETVGEAEDLFAVLDRKWKLYRRINEANGVKGGGLSRFLPPMIGMEEVTFSAVEKPRLPAKLSLRELTEQTLLNQVAPAAVLINAKGDILYFHGRTGYYLEPAPGEAGVNNILKMAREGLRNEMTIALNKAVKSGRMVRCPRLRVKTNGDFVLVNLAIRPVNTGRASDAHDPLYLVILEKGSTLDSEADGAAAPLAPETDAPAMDADARIAMLKQELRAKEEYLQTTIEELETSNEELKSSNEEMQSVNEELQSTNEELETSKEELQSVNEELATVNAELQTKVADLTRANNDMNNLLAGTGIATVFVDHELRILRFTPAASMFINLIQSDIGRPVAHINSNLIGYTQLVEDTRSVLNTLVSKAVYVQTTDAKWGRMNIQPYRTLDNVIEGAVITFVDITEMRQAKAALRQCEERLRLLLRMFSVVVFNQDRELRYTWMYHPIFGSMTEKVFGKTDAELFPEIEAAVLIAEKLHVLKTGKGTRKKIQRTVDGKPMEVDLVLEPLRSEEGTVIGITGVSTDIVQRSI